MPDVLLATDAEWVFDEVDTALADAGTTVYRVRRGVDVLPATLELDPDVVLVDLQIGNMGGIAACMELRNEAGGERAPSVPVLLLLDRAADVFLAERADADGWLIKPLDAFRLRRAVRALLDGKQYEERWDERTDLRASAVIDA